MTGTAPMTPTELFEFTNAYYRDPVPERAVDALATFVRTPWVTAPTSRAPMAYFLVRLARAHPGLVPRIEAELASTPPAGQSFVREVLRLTAAPVPLDALANPIRTGTDNDLLWAEFSLTGAREPVVRLIDVLEWPDRVRALLQTWLAVTPRWVPGAVQRWRQRRVRRRLESVLGVSDLDRPDSTHDLDCRTVLEGLQLSRERLERARRALPVPLSAEDLNHIGIKATAKWSLWSRAQDDPRVFEICASEVSGRHGRARRALLDIVEAVR